MAFPSGWSGYEEIHIRNFPSYATTTGQIFRVNTEGFSSAWKSLVGVSGQDIRVTTANGNRLPVDVISMEDGNGYLEFNLTGNYPRDPRERIRFWVGNPDAVFEDPTGNYGQYAVYPFNLFGYYPSGAGTDRTRYQNHLTGLNTATGDRYISTLPSTFYNGAYNYCNITGATGVPITMGAFYKTSVMTGNQVVMGIFNSESTGNSYKLWLRGSTDSTALSVRNETTTSTVVGDDYVSGAWGSLVGTFSSNVLREIYNNGASQGDGTTSISGTGINRLSVGADGGAIQSGHAIAHICMVELYSGAKAAAAILHDYNTTTGNVINNGWFPAFNPDGWSGYDEVTIRYEASGSLYDHVYLLSTCLLSNTLLTNSNSSGADLRITKIDNVTELPIDVINFNQSPTGMLAFSWPGVKPSGQQDKIRVWAANPSAVAHPATGEFGQYRVYNSGVTGFYPDGGGNDRTRNQNHMTSSNVTVGNLSGPLSGLKATNYPGTNSAMSVVSFASNIIRPLNIWSVFWTDITNQNQVVAAAGVSSASSRYNNTIRLNTSTGVGHHMDVSAGSLETIAKSGFSVSTWYAADAYNDSNILKQIHLNGQYQNSGSIAITFGIANFTIGGYSGTTSPATGSLLDGRVSLTAFDVGTRYGYEPIYNYEMLFNHNNFYGAAGWTAFGSEDEGGNAISLESIVNVFTSSYGRCDVSFRFEAVSLNNTNAFGSINNNLYFGLNGNINSQTYSSADLSNAVVQSLIGEINARTAGLGAIIKDVGLASTDGTNTSFSGNIVLNIPLASMSQVRTALNGSIVVSAGDCYLEPSTIEFMVYLTMNAPNPLYITRNKFDSFVYLLE